PSPSRTGAKGEGEAAEVALLSNPIDRRAFARFVTVLFMKRRKQLGTIFGRDPRKWEQVPEGITPDLRPEALKVDLVIALWRVFPETKD
ncbi:MAG: hypothetical protein O7G85_14975, partial [Planctomycetota bacterium]|nr:hypothetical protein [Planctomycetota bacterium]